MIRGYSMSTRWLVCANSMTSSAETFVDEPGAISESHEAEAGIANQTKLDDDGSDFYYD